MLTSSPLFGRLQETDPEKRKSAGAALAKTLSGQHPALHAHHEHAREGQGDLRSLARLPGCADSRHLANRVEREVVDAMVSAIEAAQSAPLASLLCLKAKWFGQKQLEFWDRNAPLPKVEQRTIPWEEARDTVLDAYAGFSPELAGLRGAF